MYQKSTSEQLNFPDFYLPFAGKLNPKNRWVILSKIIPLEDIEKHYQSQLADTGMGAPAMNGRKAFGALIIKEKMSLSDEETVEKIKENPYLQYFIGLYDYKCLLVGQTINHQQLEMYIKEERRVDDRILNVMQPHVRPIIRGKAGKKVEFGAKLSVSCVDGYVYLDRLSWDAFNESGDLEMQVEAYKTRHGHYPSSVHADKIYKTRANRAYCKAKEIRLSGPPLGRPKKETESNREELRAAKEQIYDDEIKRIEIEGKFGNCKRKGTLDRIMAKLVETSEAVIGMGLIMLNLDKALRKVLCWVWSWLYLELRGANTTLESPAKSPTNQKGNGVCQIKPLVKLAA